MLRSFNGRSPKVHPTAFVSEAAYVVGDVEIGPYSSVWPGTIIRGDHHKIVLGAYVDIQDNCVVHTDSDASAISTDPAALEPVARQLGTPMSGGELLARYRETTSEVRAIYETGLDRLAAPPV